LEHVVTGGCSALKLAVTRLVGRRRHADSEEAALTNATNDHDGAEQRVNSRISGE
jgi:hypothetical protein